MDLFDLHCDTPLAVLEGLKSAVSFPETIQKQVQTCAVFVRDDMPCPFDYYKKALKTFKSVINYPINDLTAEMSVLLSVEGGAVLEGKKERVEELFLDGISVLSLTWNGENSLAGGVNSERGLTKVGKSVIFEMNRLNMVLDLSHLNDKSFFSAVELSDLPIATHSNSRKICSHKRNLTDEQLKMIKQKNGLVGINFYPLFLGGENAFLCVYNHISHMLSLGLENNISVGSDFDGARMSTELDTTEKIHKLYAFLQAKGLKKGTIDKIFYKNALNFFKNVFDKRQKMI